MKELKLDVVRFENEDVIATSTEYVGCLRYTGSTSGEGEGKSYLANVWTQANGYTGNSNTDSITYNKIKTLSGNSDINNKWYAIYVDNETGEITKAVDHSTIGHTNHQN